MSLQLRVFEVFSTQFRVKITSKFVCFSISVICCVVHQLPHNIILFWFELMHALEESLHLWWANANKMNASLCNFHIQSDLEYFSSSCQFSSPGTKYFPSQNIKCFPNLQQKNIFSNIKLSVGWEYCFVMMTRDLILHWIMLYYRYCYAT